MTAPRKRNSVVSTADRPNGMSSECGLRLAPLVVGVGIVWGLGLARLLGEVALWPLLYSSPAVAGALAVVCAAVWLGLWRQSPWRTRPPDGCSWASFIPLLLPFPYVLGATSRPLAGGALVVGGAGLTLSLVWRDRARWVLPVALGLVTLSLYLRTLLPSVGEADTFEFQVVVPNLGVAHPTGYPLYVLLGKLFTLLPLKEVAWRLNLASAVFAVFAVWLLYEILGRLLVSGPMSQEAAERRSAFHRRHLPHDVIFFLTALAVAFSITFWSQAIVAEVYTLHSLLVVAIMGLLLHQVKPMQDRDMGWVRRWYAVFFLLGLGLTNHLTTVLLLPAALLAVLLSSRPLGLLRNSRSSRHAFGEGEVGADADALENPKGLIAKFVPLGVRDWLTAAAFFALGLSPYLFIPLRWPSLHNGTWMTLSDFISYVTGGQFHGALRLDGWQDPARWRIVGRLLHQPFGWAGLALAAAGIIYLVFHRRRALALTGLTFLAFCVYGLVYYVADIAVFLLPAHLMLAIWMGVGVVGLAELLSRVGNLDRRGSVPIVAGMGRPLLVALFALVPLSQLWTNLPAIDRSGDRGRYAWGRYALRQPLARGSAVLADPKRFAPLYYLQQVEELRPDLDMVLLGTEELYQRELRRRLGEGQTVYLARYLPDLEEFYLRSVGPLVEVTGAPDGPTLSSSDTLQKGGGSVRLLQAEVKKDPFGRRLYHVTLQWHAEASVDGDFVVRMRLVDVNGDVRWATDGERPVSGLYPTNAWPPGVPVSDYHEVPIPPWLPPGMYSLQVGLFSPFGDERLILDGASKPWFSLCTLDVELPSDPEPLSRGRLQRFGDDAWLTGVDIPQEGTADAPLTVDLAWQDVTEDQRVRLTWGQGDGAPLHTGERSALDDLARGMVRSRHVITAPSEVGAYTLFVGMAGEPARCGWLAPSEPDCSLGNVQVLGDEGRLANFGDRVLLLAAHVGVDEAEPGRLIPVALRWRGIRTMDVDYTVFVHLVGPDGQLHGQVDSWPVQGSYPTSQWSPGKGVPDKYEVRLEPDAPPGSYRVEVGLYRLETMERLRVLNAEGRPIDDSFVAGTFDVPE